MAESTCFIALGSNLGDRLQNLSFARERLSEKVKILKSSSIYETEPWGVEDQPMFLNQVIEGKTTLGALELLKFLKQIERSLGRRKTYRYGPRLIDLDILLLGDAILETPNLVIPHPCMTERSFVLVPLADLAPDLIPPGSHQSIREMLSGIDASGVRQYGGES